MSFFLFLIIGFLFLYSNIGCSQQLSSESNWQENKLDKTFNCDSLKDIYFPKIDTTKSNEIPYASLIPGMEPAQIEKGWELLSNWVYDSLNAETVFVFVIVAKDGNAYCPELVGKNYKEEHMKKSMEIVKKLKFKPAVKGNEPQISSMLIPIKYKYKDRRKRK